MPDSLRCNVCDELLGAEDVQRHVASRNHSIRKKVAEFNEMNVQFKPSYRNDVSIVSAWIRDLHRSDFLSGAAS
jgi:hypothetical protein